MLSAPWGRAVGYLPCVSQRADVPRANFDPLDLWWWIFPVLGLGVATWAGFAYIGVRAMRPAWLITAAFFAIGAAIEYPLSAGVNGKFADLYYPLGLWGLGIVASVAVTPAWLRWCGERDAAKKEQPSSIASQTNSGASSGIQDDVPIGEAERRAVKDRSAPDFAEQLSWAHLPFVDFGHSRLGRRIALTVMVASLAAAAALAGTWPFPSPGYLTFWQGIEVILGIWVIDWLLLRTATSHVFLDRAGILVIDGQEIRVDWETITGATRVDEGNYPRARVLSTAGRHIDVDDFISPSRQRRRFITAVNACVENSALRPAGQAEARAFPRFRVSLGFGAAAAVIVVIGAIR